MKKAAIFDPYLNTLGGGEKYVLTIAETLLENNWQVNIFTKFNHSVLDKASARFNLNLSNLKIQPDIFNSKTSLIDKYKITSKYDLFFYLNDGSVPILFSKNNILHVQVPFNINPSIFQKTINLIKFIPIGKIIVNSKFTQARVKKIYLKSSTVLYPPIDTTNFIPAATKQNIILSVGRFDNILNTKRQDILIDSFINMYKLHKLSNWRFVLIGGSLKSEKENKYLTKLKTMAKGYPIEFLVNSSFTDLKKYYSISKIFWHAAGFGVDEINDPQSTEHFGMSTVEAMAAGLVPVVVNKGGLKEIVSDNVNGYLWQDQSQLIDKTLFLIKHPKILERLSKKSIKMSKKFSVSNFKQKFIKIIS